MSTPTAITRDWVIDCDTHITEPADVWTARLPAKFRDRAPVIVHDQKMGWDVWKIGEAQSLLTVGHTAVAGWPEPFPAAPKTFSDVPRAAHDAKARLEYMDSIGIWAMALYPNVGGFGNEAFLMLQEGVASARDIDKALKLGLNHPMGPFEMVDLVGLDTRLAVLQFLQRSLGEKYRPAPLLVQHVKAGRLGRKAGRGVYEYGGGE